MLILRSSVALILIIIITAVGYLSRKVSTADGCICIDWLLAPQGV